MDFELRYGTNHFHGRDSQDEVQQVLDDGGAATALAPAKTLAGLHHKVEVLKECLMVQERRFGDISRSVSHRIIGQAKPEHTKLVASIADSLAGLQNALRAEVDFRKALTDDNVDVAGLVAVVTRSRPSLIRDALHVDIDAFVSRFQRHGYDI